LVDDRVARRGADQKGLLTTGTTGVLEEAAAKGLLNLPQVVKKLLSTTFRIDAEVVREVLNRDAAQEDWIGTVAR
jgi:predicted nucleic acid-binding protein